MGISKKCASTLDGIDRRGTGNQYRARVRINGQRQSKTFETEAGAQAWLVAVRAEHHRPDRAERAVEAKGLTLGQALHKRLEHIATSKNIRNERYAVERLETDFGALCTKSIYDIDEIDIQDFISERRTQVAPATVNRDLSILSHTFNLARSTFGCTHLRTPIGPTTRLRPPRGRVRRLSHEEEQFILHQAAIYEVSSQVRIRSIIRFACNTAMRCGEIASMRWENVDLVQGTVFLPETKNGESRAVPLWLEMRALLRDLGPTDEGPVWSAYEAIRSAWKRVRAAAIKQATSEGRNRLAASLCDLRFHDLRHEGTSRLIERTGWENSRIQAITGHKTAAMLTRYTHLRSGDLASQMAALEGGNANIRLIHSAEEKISDELPTDVRKKAAWLAIRTNKQILAALVIARPVTDIAADFGVTDVAVHKACERLKIEKPPQGFWLRGRIKSSVR